MIHIEKDFKQVPNFLRDDKAQKNIENSLENKKITFGRYVNIRKELVKELKYIYNNKCGFCESKLYENPTIDDYRPKSKYYWLFYEWSNKLLVCSSCNMHKSNKFEIEGKEVNAHQKNRKEWVANSKTFLDEKFLLFHPEIDYPEKFLYFTNDGYIHSDNDKGKYTIDVCNLNRESLVARRKDVVDNFFKKLEYIILLVNKGVSDEIVKIAEPIFRELKKASDRSNEFSLLHKNMLEKFDTFFLSSFNDNNKDILNNIYNTNFKENTIIDSKMNIESIVIENIQLIGESSQDIYEVKDNILPYAVKQLHVQFFHGIKHTEMIDIPTDTQWIFLTGENGFGKTTILQSLVLGLNGNKDKNGNSLNDEDFLIGIEFKNRDSNQVNNVGAEEFIPFKNFVAYGSSRLNIDNGGKKTQSTRTYSIFHSDGYLLNIEDVLKRYAFRDEEKFKNIVKILCQLMPNIEKIEVEDKGREDVVLYYEKDEEGKEHPPVKLSQLASGYRSIIAMFGDMILRLSERQDINFPHDLEGIAIIDELDLHFHPNWQKKLPQLLSKAFPKIQFIVSTHSVMPILGALKNSIFLKVTRDKENGVKLHKIDIDVTNLLPNTILTSPIFDFEGLIASSNKKIENVRTEKDYAELLRNDEIKKRLDSYEQANQDFPDNLFE